MIYPGSFPQHKQNYAEGSVFKALTGLNTTDFDIFYNKSFAGNSPREASHYEIDFLLFDLRGDKLNHVFIIEVKGGAINYSSRHNQWSSNNLPLDKGPDEQAMGYVSNILERYKSSLINKVGVTWLLWFPDGVKGKAYLPSNLQSWRVLDQNSLNNPLQFFDQAICEQAKQGHSFPGFEIDSYKDCIKPDLRQDFHVSANLKALLGEMKITFDGLEEQQKCFFSGMLGINRLAIEGGAGSGKSVMAKGAAFALAEQGKKVLLLCFNKHLKNNLSAGLSENVHVNTIHTFMLDHIGAQDYQWFADQDKSKSDLFEKIIPSKYKEMIKKHPVPFEQRYDVILVDEGQDMHQGWIKLIMHVLKRKGQMMIFYDKLQNIFHKEFVLPESESWVPFQLGFNYRNTKKINDFINKTLETNFVSAAVPEGKEVVVKSYERKADLPQKLQLLLKQLHQLQKIPLSAIKILVDGSSKNWQFLETECDIPIRNLDPNQDVMADVVYFTSVNRFKGCESDVIILLLDGPLKPVQEEDRKVRYTQFSRAKGMLWVMEMKD